MNVEVYQGWETQALLKIFHECRSLTGVGELNPLWKIFNECRSLPGVGNSSLIEDLQ